MPIYIYENPIDGSFVEIMQKMNDIHEYTKNGIKYKRIFTKPQAATNGLSPIDPHSEKAFREKTGAMKGTIGDMWDLSKEMSERRAEKAGGVDEIKQKFLDVYKNGSKSKIPHSAELVDGQKKAQKQFTDTIKKLSKDTGLD